MSKATFGCSKGTLMSARVDANGRRMYPWEVGGIVAAPAPVEVAVEAEVVAEATVVVEVEEPSDWDVLGVTPEEWASGDVEEDVEADAHQVDKERAAAEVPAPKRRSLNR